MDVENKKLNNIIDNFKKSFLKKYEVSNFDFENDKLDYSDLDNFEKSILRQFENKNINFKRQHSTNNVENKNQKKLFW